MVHRTIVLLSGGQDSTTALFWAQEYLEQVLAVSFAYGQRHGMELEAAKEIAELAGVPWETITVPELAWRSALTHAEDPIAADGGYLGLPTTYTPGRNVVFFAMAASMLANLGGNHIVAGICQTDFSGYPDCRRPFVDALQNAIALGMEYPIIIHTPMMYLTKAETVHLARRLEGCWDALALSITCYHGKRPGCGTCPACLLRDKGFDEAGYIDPARDARYTNLRG